ncbi:MAG: redoxin family protein [Nocardioidaceae bacterium]
MSLLPVRIVVPAVLIALLTVAGCGSRDAVPAADATGGESADLVFTARTLDGASFDGTSLAGRPAVLWFWAPWCPTCRAQAPAVARLAKRYEGQVSVLGVGGLAAAADIRAFAEQVDGPLHLVDEPGEVWRHFGVTAQSTYLVIDGEGRVVDDGYLDDDDLAAEVARLVG